MSLFIRAALLLLSVLVLAPVQGGAQVTLSSQELGIFTRMRDASGQNRPSLTLDPILTRVAREKAADLGRRNYFAHVNPDGHGPNWLVRQAGYRLPAFWGTGAKDNYIESIAAGNASSSSTWDQWMGSSGHRTHLLASSNFYKDQTAVGIGYASVGGSSYQHYWVVLTAPPMAAPALTIAAPANATRVTAPQVTVSGVSGGMPAAAAVQVRLTNASGVGAYRAAGGLGAWSTLVTGLTPGPNTIHVRALDASGSQLSEQARTVTYVVLKPITIAIVGEGTITAGFAGTTSREVGTAYTLATSPAADWMFQGWTGSITSTAPRLGFVMREGLALTATFVPNPFLPHKGRYEASVGGEGAFSPETSGVLRVLLGSTGSYSADYIAQMVLDYRRFLTGEASRGQ